MQKANIQTKSNYRNTHSSVGPSQGISDYSMLRPRESIKRVVQQFDFKQFTGEKGSYPHLFKKYLEATQASSKRSMEEIVTKIDDLGPEIILNL